MSTGSRDFDATSDRLEWGTWGFTTGTAEGDGATLSCWVRFDALSTSRDDRFISKADGTGAANHDWMLGKTYNGTNHVLRARMFRSVTIVATSGALSTGVWYHCAVRSRVTSGSQVVEVYLGGILVGSGGGGNLNITSNTNLVYVGNQPTSTTSAPDGLIADAAVWSVVLTPTQIADLAALTTRPSDYTTGLEGYLSGGDLTDSSANGRDATNSGTTLSGDDPGFGGGGGGATSLPPIRPLLARVPALRHF